MLCPCWFSCGPLWARHCHGMAVAGFSSCCAVVRCTDCGSQPGFLLLGTLGDGCCHDNSVAVLFCC